MLNYIKNKKLFIFFFFLSLFIFIHSFYKAEIIWKGENNEFYFQYYILSLILFFIGLITLFLNKNLKKILKKISNKAKTLNANIIFVYLPAYKSFEINSPNKNNYLETIHNVQQENISIIDVRDYFKNNDPYSYFPNRKNGHYTVEG